MEVAGKRLGDQRLLKFMKFLSWTGCISLGVKAVSILMTFAVSCWSLKTAQNLYDGLDFLPLTSASFAQYTFAILSFALTKALQAFVFYLLLVALRNLNFQTPFTLSLAGSLEKMGAALLACMTLGFLNALQVAWLASHGIKLIRFGNDEYFLAGLLFILSRIISHGNAIQIENELTV